jgi:SAM-dependent methyltransferase
MTQGFQLQAQAPAAYERYLVPVLFAPCAERLLDLVAVEPGDRVLDVACGTGIVARLAAARPLPGGAFDVVCCQQGPAVLHRPAAGRARGPAGPGPGWTGRHRRLGPPLAALDEEARQALARDLDQTLGEWADDDGLVCPMETWLATARR